jgi:hypothetical protein
LHPSIHPSPPLPSPTYKKEREEVAMIVLFYKKIQNIKYIYIITAVIANDDGE